MCSHWSRNILCNSLVGLKCLDQCKSGLKFINYCRYHCKHAYGHNASCRHHWPRTSHCHKVATYVVTSPDSLIDNVQSVVINYCRHYWGFFGFQWYLHKHCILSVSHFSSARPAPAVMYHTRLRLLALS